MSQSSSSSSSTGAGTGGGSNKPKPKFSFVNKNTADIQNNTAHSASISSSTTTSITRSPLGARNKNSSQSGLSIGNRKQSTNRISVDKIIEKVFLEPGNKAQIISNIQKVYSSRYGQFFNTRQDSSTAKENKNEYKKELEATFGKAGVILNGFLNRLYWVRENLSNL